MDRLNIDQAGARHGELFAHSLQLGDDTVTLENIATMSIESERFRPFETPRNRRVLGFHVGMASLSFVIAGVCLIFWAFQGARLFTLFGLASWALALIFVLFSGLALRLALRIRHEQPFFRLRIGAADGRQIDLVDDSRDVLVRIRDTIREKIDNEDAATTGRFDLDRDLVEIRRGNGRV